MLPDNKAMLPDRDPAHLHPNFRARVRELERRLEEAGLPFKFYEGHRGKKRQEQGKGNGKSKASFLQSWHNYDCAGDFVGVVGGKWSWHNSLPWAEYGKIADDLSLNWAGHWKTMREMVHVQSAEFSYRDLQSGILAEPSACDEQNLWFNWFSQWLPGVYDTHVGVACVQRLLVLLEQRPGEVDGFWGPKTARALGRALGIRTKEYLNSRQAMTDLLTLVETELP